jgi:folate-dependent phosphoribosylglycinamide formyltransferase PurN
LIDTRIYKNINRFIATDYRSKSLTEREETYDYYLRQYDIITLHGWLNIIPAKVCEDYNIYNGHPGLITLYPELKGRDPQLKAWNSLCRYMYLGSVVHNVTATVDAGKVITEDKVFAAIVETLDETYDILKQTSLNSWVDFFKYKHYNKVC